jgi:hypothetical protein
LRGVRIRIFAEKKILMVLPAFVNTWSGIDGKFMVAGFFQFFLFPETFGK